MRFKTYLDTLRDANGLEKNIEWLFYPGMLADTRAKWWGDFGRRPASHEGLDICFYRSLESEEKKLAPGTRVPARFGGRVLNICEDFLGHSLVVQMDRSASLRTVAVYSHIVPSVETGRRVSEGDTIARTFDTRLNNSILPSHLHISCIELPIDIPFEMLNWDLFPLRDRVNIINPVFL